MSPTSRVGRVRVGGVEIEYEEAGEGVRPFVLVHGFTGSRDDFREHVAPLAALGRTLVPDQRGHGGSTNLGEPAGYTLDALVGDLDAFLDAAGAPRCDLLGHSMGGMVALRLALRRPDRVASLILMDTAAGPLDARVRPAFDALGQAARQLGMAHLARLAREHGKVDPQRPPAAKRCEERMGSDLFWARIEAKLLRMDPEAFATLGPMLALHESVGARLGEIRCPTLVMVGEQDRPFLPAAEELARGIPRARHVVIEGAAHSPQLESPESWLAAVRDHLARARAESAPA
jgi:pimeloyl-ACP methyl ester carboxylesterase